MPSKGQPGCSFVRPGDIINQWRDKIVHLPRPRPDEQDEKNYRRWRQEFRTWRDLRCKNMLGYFCRKHGLWIACDEIRLYGLDSKRPDNPDRERCPPSHAAFADSLKALYDQLEQDQRKATYLLEAEASQASRDTEDLAMSMGKHLSLAPPQPKSRDLESEPEENVASYAQPSIPSAAGKYVPRYSTTGYSSPGYSAPGYSAPGYSVPGYSTTTYPASTCAGPSHVAPVPGSSQPPGDRGSGDATLADLSDDYAEEEEEEEEEQEPLDPIATSRGPGQQHPAMLHGYVEKTRTPIDSPSTGFTPGFSGYTAPYPAHQSNQRYYGQYNTTAEPGWSKEDLPEHVAHFESRCWSRAQKRYNDQQRPGKTTSRYFQRAVPHDASLSAHQLVEESREACRRAGSSSKRSPRFLRHCLYVATQLHRFERTIDVAVQLEPAAIAVWAPIRAILQVLDEKEQTSHVALEGLYYLARQLDRWNKFATVFVDEDDANIEEAVVDLYVPFIGFLAIATRWLAAKSTHRLRWTLTSKNSLREKLEDRLKEVKEAADALNVAVVTQNIIQDNDFRNKTSAQLSGLPDFNYQTNALNRKLDALVTGVNTAKMSISLFHTLREGAERCDPALKQDGIRLREVQAWLTKGACSLGMDNNHDLEPIPETGQWIDNVGNFKKWLDKSDPGDNKSVLWVQGKPGSGKTHLAISLARRLRESTKRSIMLQGFRARAENKHASNPSSLAACILETIFGGLDRETQYELLPRLVEKWKIHPEGPQTCPWKAIWPICETALEHAGDLRHTLIIDGLDECNLNRGERPSLPTLDEFIGALMKLTEGDVFRIVFMSRPKSEYDRFVREGLAIRIDKGHNRADIDRFVAERLDASRCRIPEHLKAQVVKATGERADGMFLWPRELIKYLEGRPCEDDVFVAKTVSSFPSGLGPMYDELAKLSASRLDPVEQKARMELLQLVIMAQEPFSPDEVGRMLRWGSYDVPRYISQLGQPFLEVHEGRVRAMHASVADWTCDGSQGVASSVPRDKAWPTAEDCHASLAKQCFRRLLEAQYSSPARIGRLIHQNFGSEKATASDVDDDDTWESMHVSFGYAAKYWVGHLTALKDPDSELVGHLKTFLLAFNFAYWAEFCQADNNFATIRQTLIDLKNWVSGLTPEKRALIELDKYYYEPFLRLSEAFREAREEDQQLQYLTLYHLASYLVDVGTASKAAPIFKQVVEGLENVLGYKHPLTLRARTDNAVMYLEQGAPDKARIEFTNIYAAQDERLGPDNPELWDTMHCIGEAQLLETHYKESRDSQHEAGVNLLRLVDPESSVYLRTRTWGAYASTYLGNLDEALEVLTDVFELRRKLFGEHDLWAAQAQCMIGDIQRRKGNATDSVKNLKNGLKVKEILLDLSTIWSTDAAIALLMAYWDFSMTTEALALIDRLDKEAKTEQHFERYCQISHIRALVTASRGYMDKAILEIQGLLIQTDREDYNRYLLWAVLDLADLLRERNKPGDSRQALANFNHILADKGSDNEWDMVDVNSQERSATSSGGESGQETPDSDQSGDDIHGGREPDPPRLLQLSEDALKLARKGDFAGVSRLFREERVDWYRRKDLWVAFGGPAAETGFMKGPRVHGRRKW